MRAQDAFRSVYLSGWRVDFTERVGVAGLLSRAALARTVARTLEAAGAPRPASIGLILSDDRELQQLNEQATGVEAPTDVLSFPLLPPESFPVGQARSAPLSGAADSSARATPPFALPPGRRTHLGDIVVSVERAIAQAEAGRGGQTGDVRWSPADELRLLVIHGALHVCGWDHAEPEEEAAMRAMEQKLLALPGLSGAASGERSVRRG